MQNDQYHTKWHYQTHVEYQEMSRVTEENDPLILNHKFSVMKTRKKSESRNKLRLCKHQDASWHISTPTYLRCSQKTDNPELSSIKIVAESTYDSTHQILI